MSMLNVPIKVGGGARSTVLVLDLPLPATWPNTAPTASQISGISMLMNLYPAGLFFLLTILIISVSGYRLNEQKVGK